MTKGAVVLKGFKDFLMRGNIIDLAVAVVVGSAFTALVSGFTTNIIKPIIAATGSGEVGGLGIQIQAGNQESIIDFASVINAVITFLITAAVVYFLFVLPMQKLQERRKQGQEETADPTEVELLLEIRDLLRREQDLPPVQGLAPEADKTENADESTPTSPALKSTN